MKDESKLLGSEGSITGKNFLPQSANLPWQNAKWKRHVNKMTSRYIKNKSDTETINMQYRLFKYAANKQLFPCLPLS